MGHDPDRPCVGESGGIPLVTNTHGPGRDWSFAPMGLVLVCDTPLICRKGRMFNAPDIFDKPGRTLPVLGSEIDDSRHGLYVEVIYVEV